jgi:hypothetical protein
MSHIYIKTQEMEFRTKLDYSSNRQIKQRPETFTVLSGGTVFGVPFSALTTGPDLLTSAITSTQTSISSTFSGNSSVTNYTWFNTNMQIAASTLSALTPSNSGITQNTGQVYVSFTTTQIDGNLVTLVYTGVSFDIKVTNIISLGGGAYSGTVVTNTLQYLSANGLDFTGRTIWVDVSGITRTQKLLVTTTGATFSNIGSQPSAGTLHYTSDGTLTTNTSDRRLKTNIQPITNALSKILLLTGVTYNWYNMPEGKKRIGFIAQEVGEVVPELVFTNENTPEKFMGVHYDNVTSLLVEAIKELISGDTINKNIELRTQSIIAEDNNIELNYGGNHTTANNGGIKIAKGIDEQTDSEFTINENGDWITNNVLKPKEMVIPFYTPISSDDDYGNNGTAVRDDEYFYIKNNNGKWMRTKLELF